MKNSNWRTQIGRVYTCTWYWKFSLWTLFKICSVENMVFITRFKWRCTVFVGLFKRRLWPVYPLVTVQITGGHLTSKLGCHRWSQCWSLTTWRREHQSKYKFFILNKTFTNWFKSKWQYMYIVHIKITLHIQVLVWCKKCSYPIDYGPIHNLCTPPYMAKTIDDTC